MENLYPVVFGRMIPYIDEAIESEAARLGEDMSGLTEESLGRMVQYLLKKSNFIVEPPPHWHNERTLNDIGRALVLDALLFDYADDDAEAMGVKTQSCPYCNSGFPFFPFYPFFPFPRRGFRRPFRPGFRPGFRPRPR